MDALLRSALYEREQLQFEREEMLEAIADKNFPEHLKEEAEFKLLFNENNLNMIDGIIARRLELTPIDDVLNDINTNLSEKCN